MVELKATDGSFFLGPVVMVISWFFMTGTEATDSVTVVLKVVWGNLVAMITFGLGVILLAIASGVHSPLLSGATFMSLEGTGLFSAILGFFFYGSAMGLESSDGAYRLFLSQPQFLVGLVIWAAGVFLITFGGVGAKGREESIIFLNTWITMAVANYFIWEVILGGLH